MEVAGPERTHRQPNAGRHGRSLPIAAGGGVGAGLVDINTGLVMAFRDHRADREVVETQSECTKLNEGENEIRDELASAAVLGGPRWESNPDMNPTAGLDCLETWLWYSDPAQVGPIEANRVEPLTGIEFGVPGLGWAGSLSELWPLANLDTTFPESDEIR